MNENKNFDPKQIEESEASGGALSGGLIGMVCGFILMLVILFSMQIPANSRPGLSLIILILCYGGGITVGAFIG
ncbi:MAG: hypothetical protein GX303_07395 [Clostridiales bacterium]|nr:hypothetical protein [Clostridiales bacterium]